MPASTDVKIISKEILIAMINNGFFRLCPEDQKVNKVVETYEQIVATVKK